jgi:hypothetical protein
MSKPGPTTTSTNNATLPPHITQAQQNLLGQAGNLTSNFTGAAPNFGVMGLTSDQLLASDLARQTAHDVFNRPSVSALDVFGMGNQWNTGQAATAPAAQAAQATFSPAAAAAQAAPAAQAATAQATAAQLDPGAISSFMNPYIQTAINPVLDRLKQQQQEVQSGIGANAAASHMFGGSREAVSRMLADRNYRDTVGNTVGGMMMQGWDKASGLASGNTDRSQQTNLANAGWSNNQNQFNAGQTNQTNQFNAGQTNQISSLNAQLQNAMANNNAGLATQAAMQGAGFGNQAALQQQQLAYQGAQNDASRFLQGLQLQGNMDTQNLQNQQSMINMLNQFGGQQRAVGQQAIDAPFTALQRQQQVLSGMQSPTSSTTTSQTSKPADILGTLLGLGGMAFGGPAGGTLGSAIGGGLSSMFAPSNPTGYTTNPWSSQGIFGGPSYG